MDDNKTQLIKAIDDLIGNCSDQCKGNPDEYNNCISKFQQAFDIARKNKLYEKQIEAAYRLMFCFVKYIDIDNATIQAEVIQKLIKQGYTYGNLHKVFTVLGRVYWLKEDFDKALSVYLQALDKSKECGDFFHASGVCMNISTIFRMQGKIDFSIEYINEAIRGFQECNDARMVQVARSNLANLYNDQGMLDKALEMKLEGAEYYISIGSKEPLALELNAIAVIYNKMNRLDKAIEYALKSIKIKEELNDLPSLAVSWNNLGVFYKDYHDYKSAQKYFQKALAQYKKSGEKNGIAMTLNNIGNLYLGNKEYELALDYYQKVLTFRQEMGNTEGLAIVLENIGTIYNIHFHDYDRALGYFEQASKIATEIQDIFLYTSIQLEKIEALIHRKEYNEALNQLREIEQLIIENKLEKYESEVFKTYEMLYSEMNEYEKAYQSLKKYSELKAKYTTSDSISKIAEMQTRFETEKKEKEAEIFRLKNIELEEKNKQIEEQKAQLQETLDKLQNSEIRYNFVTEELTRNIKTTLIGKSEATHNITEMISMVARSDKTNVLITGETGTGKEIVARNIHACSKRNKNPFYAVNCSAVPENLFESQFFGHEKDAFTGASSTKIGWFEIADKSTLFLDEVCSLSLDQQAKLLRVLEERSIVRVGSHREIPVDVRIISAANCNLLDKVNAEQFRRDLYHRLAIFVINIPPLRERKEEIPLLFRHFVGLSSLALNKKINKVEKNIISYLMDYNFPGNVRELRNIVERAVLVADSSTLRLEHLMIPGKTEQPVLLSSIIPLADMERQLLIKTLQSTGFNKVQAAKLLQVERKVVERKIKKYNLTPDDM